MEPNRRFFASTGFFALEKASLGTEAPLFALEVVIDPLQSLVQDPHEPRWTEHLMDSLLVASASDASASL
jgi:hypothetical protein